MNKADLVEKIAGACEISKAQAAAAVDAVFKSLEAFLHKGVRVSLADFGTFPASQRKIRDGRSPQTSAPTKITVKKASKSSAGRQLKKAVKDAAKPGDAFVRAMEELSEYYS